MCDNGKKDRENGESKRKEEEEEERVEEEKEVTQSEQGEMNGSVKEEGNTEEGLGQDGLRLDPQNSQKSKVNVKMNTKVYKPTKAEIEDHEVHHCPFKAWCRHCVKGRAANRQHRQHKLEDEDENLVPVPRVSMDYFFMSKKDEEAKNNPLIVMVDEKTGERYARAVSKKGAGTGGEMDWLIQDMVDELKGWGHTGGANGHIIMKSDNEPAVKALREAVGKLLGGRVIPENPPKGESASNGKVEGAGQVVRGFVRVLKSKIEEETKIKLESQDIIMQWMVRWGAMLPSRFLAGKDGKTPYERRRGRKCQVPTEKFGEMVWYKELKSKTEAQNKLEDQWREGIWLGHTRDSNEAVIGTKERVVKAFAIRKKPVEEQWDGQWIKEMKGTPEQPNPNKKGLTIPIHVRFDAEEETSETEIDIKPARREDKPRAIYIKQWMTEEYGFTEDCPGCDAKRAGMSIPKPHNLKCRERLEEAMKNDERGKKAQELVEERWKHWTAKEMEKDDKKAEEENKKKQATEEHTEPAGKAKEGRKEKNDEKGTEGHAEAETNTNTDAEDSGGAACSDGRDYNTEAQEGKRSGKEEEQAEAKKRRIEEEKQANMKRVLEGMSSENEKRRKVFQEAETKRKTASEAQEMEKRRKVSKDAEAKRRAEAEANEREKRRKIAQEAEAKRKMETERGNSSHLHKKAREDDHEETVLLTLHPGRNTRVWGKDRRKERAKECHKQAEERTMKISKEKKMDKALKILKVMTIKKEDKVINHMDRLQQCGVDENHEPVFHAQDDDQGCH